MIRKMWTSEYITSLYSTECIDVCCSVNAGFDEHDFPMDVIWLDIEHTDGKKLVVTKCAFQI